MFFNYELSSQKASNNLRIFLKLANFQILSFSNFPKHCLQLRRTFKTTLVISSFLA